MTTTLAALDNLARNASLSINKIQRQQSQGFELKAQEPDISHALGFLNAAAVGLIQWYRAEYERQERVSDLPPEVGEAVLEALFKRIGDGA